MRMCVSFYEDQEIIKLVDKIAKSRGINRSGFIRESLRKALERILRETPKDER